MSWVTISESDVITKLSGPELAAMKTAALQAAQTNPLLEVITQVIREIRGYVAACSKNALGDGATVPDELLGVAISRIRFELATRLPVASLLTDDRRTANENALTLLRSVARCEFAIVPPATPAADQPGGTPVKVAKSTTLRTGRSALNGL
jgi:hypothetical protein